MLSSWAHQKWQASRNIPILHNVPHKMIGQTGLNSQQQSKGGVEEEEQDDNSQAMTDNWTMTRMTRRGIIGTLRHIWSGAKLKSTCVCIIVTDQHS